MDLQLVWIVSWLQWSSPSSRQLEDLCVLLRQARLKNEFWLLSRIPVTHPLSGVTGCQAVRANRTSSGAMPHLPCVQHLLRDAERHGWAKLLFFLLFSFSSLKEELGRVLSGEERFLQFSNNQRFVSVSSFGIAFSAEWCRGTAIVHPMLPPVDLSWLNSKWTFSFRACAFGLLLESEFWFIAYLNRNCWNEICKGVCGFFFLFFRLQSRVYRLHRHRFAWVSH